MPPQPRCAKECCNAKSTQENKYCRKHQLQIFIDETESLGKRVCKNVIRGCTAQLDPNYEFVRCEPCRKLEKERDDARKARALENATKQENPETRFCKNCEKTKPLDEFVGVKNKGYVKSCKDCRETWIRNDKTRDKEHRNALAREASKKPERIAVKKAWEEANPDKVEQKIKKSRAKRAAKDIDGYLQHNANVMKNWRDRNPEKMEEANKKRRESGFVLARGTSARTETFFGEIAQESLQKNMEAHYQIYKRSARTKKLDFAYSEEEFKALVEMPCYYCNTVDEKGFNEIDRMNQCGGYIQSNGVSCCAMCNWLKGYLDSATFIKRAKHIYSFKNRANPGDPKGVGYGKFSGATPLGVANENGSQEERFPECFPDAKCVSYASYRSRAGKKELEFSITNADYKSIIQEDCYLCGKQTTETNINGVDRVDNTVGYTVANCKACCKECNHMKNNYALDDLFAKIERITSVWSTQILPVLPAQIHSIVQISEKMSKAELDAAKKEKKERTLQKHRQYLESIGE